MVLDLKDVTCNNLTLTEAFFFYNLFICHIGGYGMNKNVLCNNKRFKFKYEYKDLCV